MKNEHINKLYQNVIIAQHTVGNVKSYQIGGSTRDEEYYRIFGIERPIKDYDFVTVSYDPKIENPGIAVVKELAKLYKTEATIFLNFMTANLMANGIEVEFVGARKETYLRGSRNPIVEKGTLRDDVFRRDFTINALAKNIVTMEIIDMVGGLDDLKNKIIRCVKKPRYVFKEDALRMLRAIRFACQLGFTIEEETWKGICENVKELIYQKITGERIFTEIDKIFKSDNAALGLELLKKSGILAIIFPEVNALDFENVYVPKSEDEAADLKKRGISLTHKNNFWHTVKVENNLDNLTPDITSLIKGELRLIKWGALLHDIGKALTVKWDNLRGWIFDHHERVSRKLALNLIRRLKFPFSPQELEYVLMIVADHGRVQVITINGATDSALRRVIVKSQLINIKNTLEKEVYISDLIVFGMNDCSSSFEAKKQMYKSAYRTSLDRCLELIASDTLRNLSIALTGIHVMEMYNLQPSKLVGEIKDILHYAFLDGIIKNTYQVMYDYITNVLTTELLNEYRNQGSNAIRPLGKFLESKGLIKFNNEEDEL